MPVGDVSLTLVVVTNSAFKGDIRLNGLPLIDYDPDLEWVIPRPHGMLFYLPSLIHHNRHFMYTEYGCFIAKFLCMFYQQGNGNGGL